MESNVNNSFQKKDSPRKKPTFPPMPFPYFYLFNFLKSRINWNIDNVGDIFANLFFCILALFAIVIDFSIIILVFIFRIAWWLVLLVGYLFGIKSGEEDD